jgi:hypothetical protein
MEGIKLSSLLFREVLLNISQKHPRLIVSTERFILSLRGGMAGR